MNGSSECLECYVREEEKKPGGDHPSGSPEKNRENSSREVSRFFSVCVLIHCIRLAGCGRFFCFCQNLAIKHSHITRDTRETTKILYICNNDHRHKQNQETTQHSHNTTYYNHKRTKNNERWNSDIMARTRAIAAQLGYAARSGSC